MAPLSEGDIKLLAASCKFMKSKPEIDWEPFLADTDYKNLSTLKVRYGQVWRKLQGNDVNSSAPSTPKSNKRGKAGSGPKSSEKPARVTKNEDDGYDWEEATTVKEEADEESPKKKTRHRKATTIEGEASADEEGRYAHGDIGINTPEGFVADRIKNPDPDDELDEDAGNEGEFDEDLPFKMDP